MSGIDRDLIAPCGMNCAVCSRYLAYRNSLKKSQCRGCRPDNKKCSYLFEKCSGINNSVSGTSRASFCSECDQYSTCKQISRMDKRYRTKYSMSVKDNLDFIKKEGMDKFSGEQYRKYKCDRCGGLISIHNRKCFKCDKITKLVEISK